MQDSNLQPRHLQCPAQPIELLELMDICYYNKTY